MVKIIAGKYNVVRVTDSGEPYVVFKERYDTYGEAVAVLGRLVKKYKDVDLIGPNGRFSSWIVK